MLTAIYDALNRCLLHEVQNGGPSGGIPNGQTYSFYISWRCVEDWNGAGAMLRQNVWGTNLDEIIQIKTILELDLSSLPLTPWPPFPT